MVQKALDRQEAACALVALAAKPLPKDAFGSMPSVLRRIALKVGMGNLRSHMANRKRWSQLREQRLESLADTRAEALRSPYAEELRCIQEFWHDMGIRKTKLRRRARQASYAKFLAERIPPACARHGLPVPPPEAIKKAVQLGARGAYGAILSLCEPLHEADELNYRLRELRRYRKPHALTWIDPDHHPVFASWEGRANGIDDLAVTDSRRRLVAVTLCGPHGRRAPREQRYKLTLSARADRRLVEDPAFQRWASSKPAEGETVSVTLWYRRGFNGRTDFTGPYLRFTVTTPDPATGVGVEAGLDLGQRRHVLAIRREQEGKVSWKPVFLNPRPTDPRRRDAGFGPAGRRAFQRTFRREQSRRRGQQRSPRADAALAKARNYVAKRFAAEIAAKCLEHGVRTLYVEDLSPAAMHTGFRTRQQNANFKEWCLRQTRIFLRNRCAREGIALKEVFPGYTSQVCAQCGAGHLWRYLVRRGPDGQRRPQRDASGPSCVCVECGAEPNPDFNASKNILRRGRREFTTPQPLDEAGKRRIQEAALKRLAAKNAAGQARI
jgi:IS605 OrfB family transposase